MNVSGIGAIPYMMNVNVTIASNDIQLGNEVAKNIRGTSPNGLPGNLFLVFSLFINFL